MPAAKPDTKPAPEPSPKKTTDAKRNTRVTHPKPVTVTRAPQQAAPQLQQQVSEPRSGTVFNPALRRKIQRAHTRSTTIQKARPPLDSWTDVSGPTHVELANGRCIRSAERTGNSMQRAATKNWYLPTNCSGDKSTGEKMLDNVQQALDSRP